jgi:hypothetical protein
MIRAKLVLLLAKRPPERTRLSLKRPMAFCVPNRSDINVVEGDQAVVTFSDHMFR